MAKKALDFFPCEDGGEAFRPFGGGKEEKVYIFVKYFAVKEEEGGEGLVLGRGGNIALGCQVGEESLDFRGAHFGRMALVVEKDEAADPVYVGFFGTVGVMFGPQDIPDLV